MTPQMSNSFFSLPFTPETVNLVRYIGRMLLQIALLEEQQLPDQVEGCWYLALDNEWEVAINAHAEPNFLPAFRAWGARYPIPPYSLVAVWRNQLAGILEEQRVDWSIAAPTPHDLLAAAYQRYQMDQAAAAVAAGQGVVQ